MKERVTCLKNKAKIRTVQNTNKDFRIRIKISNWSKFGVWQWYY